MSIVRWSMFVTALVVLMALSLIPGPASSAESAVFNGDYSVGDFSQWSAVQNVGYNGPGQGYASTYSASIVPDDSQGIAARFEVRSGDVPSFGGGERSEVMAPPDSGGIEGQVMWYQFSTKFDPTFPQDHPESVGWGVTNQFWGSSGASPPLAWSVGERDNYWSLLVHQQSQPGVYLQQFPIFETPLDAGTWHNVTMQIRWSTSDDVGWIKLWLNGIRQPFSDGADTFHIRTLIPGSTTVRYKEGYYRHRAPGTPTGVVFHAGFRCGPGEPPL